MENLNSEDRRMINVALNMAISQYERDLSNVDKHPDEHTEAIKQQLRKDIQATKQAREKMRNFI